MKQLTTLDRQRQGKRITDLPLVSHVKDSLYPLLMLMTKTKVTCRLDIKNRYAAISGRPIIFAANHSAFSDAPIMLQATGRRSYIFAGKQHLPWIDWLFFVLNGVIWVDRGDKEDRGVCQAALLAYLSRGESLLWFPEGTWNLTESQLIMPLRWGIIKTARLAGAQIIPAALEYDWDENVCRIRFGEPIYGDDLEDMAEGIRTLRDAMATLRWELLTEKPPVDRNVTTTEQLRSMSRRALEDYPALNWEYEQSFIYHPETSPEEVYAFMERLTPRRENAFLWRK